jgi:hypothetical protein
MAISLIIECYSVMSLCSQASKIIAKYLVEGDYNFNMDSVEYSREDLEEGKVPYTQEIEEIKQQLLEDLGVEEEEEEEEEEEVELDE